MIFIEKCLAKLDNFLKHLHAFKKLLFVEF